MWWSLFFPAVIIVGYWVSPSKSTIISKSVQFCWTAVEWYTILEIRSSMFIDRMKILFITNSTNQTNPTKTVVSIKSESSTENPHIDPNQESVIQSLTNEISTDEISTDE